MYYASISCVTRSQVVHSVRGWDVDVNRWVPLWPARRQLPAGEESDLLMDAVWEDAAIRGDVEAVRVQLRAGADVNTRDRHGQTALMLAAHRGHEALIETLLAHGADLNVTAKYHLSALMLAVIAGHADIARLLVRAGADLSIRGSGPPGFAGQTASDLAVARGMQALYEELVPQ